mmetsp:Transcript_1712/g.5927  ORF Transcript_1712/g.5927 Transcript_1712/m.5927 type:complete len:443 (-) Transcript_1712:201-1529(-)
MSDDEDYEYDYGSGDEEVEVADDEIEIENSFYEADDCRQDDPARAIELFERVVELETSKGDEVKWRFKALQHLVVLHFAQGETDSMVRRYEEMLSFAAQVTRNESTDAINGTLDTLSTSTDWTALSKVYEVTLAALRHQNNERLWFTTNLKLAKAYLGGKAYNKVEALLDELKRSCRHEDGSDDAAKGTHLLDVYALEIQLCSETEDLARMREVYPRTVHLNAAVADPRIMGVIREEGGRMYMRQSAWSLAYNEFYEAFRAHQEAGNPRAKSCLKYVVLANMLALSDINPFAAREAKVFQDDREIVAVLDLRMAYESNDLMRFERVLANKTNHINDDPFMMTYVDPLRRRMREQVLVNITRPYRKVTLQFLATELKLSAEEVEGLLVDMILEGRLDGQIEQINGYLLLGGERTSAASRKLQAIGKWANTLESLVGSLSARAV